MINNRTNSRRRGRGGARPNTSNRGLSDGNRIDSRARGNAHQLLEKYKSMARDAQNQGDRVVQEYYLQFADHYFRILSEANARSDEHRRQRDTSRDGDGDDDEGDDRGEGNGVDRQADQGERRSGGSPRGRGGRPVPSRNEARDAEDTADDRIEVARLPAAINAAGDNDGASDDDRAQANGAPRRARARRVPVRDERDDAAEIEA